MSYLDGDQRRFGQDHEDEDELAAMFDAFLSPDALLLDDEEDEDDWWRDDPRFDGYTRRELEEEVIFLRPEYDPEKDEFDWEGKDVSWCLANEFEEVEDGVWSGRWYWRHRGGDSAREERLRENKRKRQAVMERRERARANSIRRVDDTVFRRILHLKEQGNAAFKRKDFAKALMFYIQANKVDPVFDGLGFRLVGVQREEKIKILSNQAECYLRLQQYAEAQDVSSQALLLDKRHEKSLVRRAKAIYYQYNTQSENHYHDFDACLMLQQATPDLQKAIRLDGPGAKSARALLDEINAKSEALLERHKNGGT